MYSNKPLKNRNLTTNIIEKLKKTFPDFGPPTLAKEDSKEIYMAYAYCGIHINSKNIEVVFDLNAPTYFAAELGVCLSEFKDNLKFSYHEFYYMEDKEKFANGGEAYVKYGEELIKQGNEMRISEIAEYDEDGYDCVCKDCRMKELNNKDCKKSKGTEKIKLEFDN